MMITPPTQSFYVITMSGDAADFIMDKLSPSTAADVREVILVSEDFPEDIQSCNEMQGMINKLRSNIENVVVEETHNPLYFPATKEEIDAVFEPGVEADKLKFTAMDGNPFMMKSISVSSKDEEVIRGSVACYQFELPTYNEIVESHERLLN